MDYVQRIKLAAKSLANSLVTEFFAKRLESKGTLRCSTNGPYQQQHPDCRQTADVASGSGIQRGRGISNVGYVRKLSDKLQRRFAIDPPASNTDGPVIHVRRTSGRTPTASTALTIKDNVSKLIRRNAHFIEINDCGKTTTLVLEHDIGVKVQRKEGERTLALSVTPCNNKSAKSRHLRQTTIREFFKPSGSATSRCLRQTTIREFFKPSGSAKSCRLRQTTTREFFKPSGYWRDEDSAAGSKKQPKPIVRFTVPHDQASHPKRLRLEDGPRKEASIIHEEDRSNSWRYNMSYHS